MSNNTTVVTTSPGGVGFLGLLTLIFITLKLTDNIDWSWWWVLSPLWIPALLAVAIGAIGAVIFLIVSIFRGTK